MNGGFMCRDSDSREAEARNLALWDEIAPVHMKAYKEVAMLREGREILDEIELHEVGDVAGKTMLHLQCHIGTDTLAWARRGADVTGVDFSSRSIECARRLSAELGVPATFVHANIYDLPRMHDRSYDIVYTSKGVLCWLRDLPEWGRIVARHLQPGGVFYLMESHPLLNALEEGGAGALSFDYPYFCGDAPIEWPAGDGDYADAEYIPKNGSMEWTWSVSDILNALIDAGIQLEFVHEYPKLFFRRYASMVSEDGRWYRLPGREEKVPLLLTLRARKPIGNGSEEPSVFERR
jgi:SAM-dependent methyltransferase